jgi:hypothetical protein
MLRRRRPLFNALSLTAAAALFLVTGLIGYTLDKHVRFVAGTAWTGGVIWSQVASAPRCWCWRRSSGEADFGGSLARERRDRQVAVATQICSAP